MIPARFDFYAFVIVTCTMLLNCIDGQASSRDASCGQTFIGNASGQLLSPGYPENYTNSQFCNYAIQLPSNRQVNLTFTEVELEIWNTSLVDFIVLFDGVDCMSNRIAAVVNISAPTYISRGNSMVALFASGINTQTGRFAATFTTESTADPTEPVPPFPENKILIQCGNDIKAENGKLSYKGEEGSNYLCIWRISVEYGKVIAFNLTKLYISYPENWLRILDGSNCGAPVVYFVYGDSEHHVVSITSTSNTIMVIYAALNGDETDSFEANYNMVSAPPGTTSEVSTPTGTTSEVPTPTGTTSEVSTPTGTTSEAGSKLISMAASNLLLITAARSYALS